MVWKKIIGQEQEEKKQDEDEEIDIESYLSELDIREGKIIEREDVVYVKPVDVRDEDSLEKVNTELGKTNIVVANVKHVTDNLMLRKLVNKMKEMASEVDGDLGRISQHKILVVPAGTKIVHRR